MESNEIICPNCKAPKDYTKEFADKCGRAVGYDKCNRCHKIFQWVRHETVSYETFKVHPSQC